MLELILPVWTTQVAQPSFRLWVLVLWMRFTWFWLIRVSTQTRCVLSPVSSLIQPRHWCKLSNWVMRVRWQLGFNVCTCYFRCKNRILRVPRTQRSLKHWIRFAFKEDWLTLAQSMTLVSCSMKLRVKENRSVQTQRRIGYEMQCYYKQL